MSEHIVTGLPVNRFLSRDGRLGMVAPLPLVQLTTSQRDALSGSVNGQLIYNTTTNAFNGYANGAWGEIGGGLTIGSSTISGGATTQVLYNLAGVVSSDAGFTYNPSTDILTLNGPIKNSNNAQGLWSNANTGTNAGRIFVDDNTGFFMGYGSAVTITGSSTTLTTRAPTTDIGSTGSTSISSARFGIQMDLTTGSMIFVKGIASTSGSAKNFLFTPAADTGLTASTEVNSWHYNGARTVQWATGALTTQREVLFSAPTYAFVGASTLTTAATVAISGAPIAGTNATITTPLAFWVQAGTARFDGRVLETQGADVASANNLTLGTDGNCFEITGTTTINLISNVNWQNGSVVTLLFTSTPTVTHNAATSGTNITIQLAGAANFSATAGDTLTLRLSEIGGTQAWREIGKALI